MATPDLQELDYSLLDGLIQRELPEADRKATVTADRKALIRRYLSHKYEGLSLYEPLPLGILFHACNALWCLVGESNRAGKSLAAAAEGSYAMTGTHPHGLYPKHGGFALFVGLKLDHIHLMYRTMFLPGAFQIIKDEITGLWRAVQWDPKNPRRLMAYDEAYREKWRDAPPLIPPRMVHSVAWEDHKKGIPRRVMMTNGWHSLWLSALGDPDQGSHYNLVHFDEEMPNGDFYLEAHRGLTRIHETVKQRPKGIWSATSQVSNIELAELRERAEADPDSEEVQRFTFQIEDNPYISPDAKASFKSGLREEEIQTRYYGIPAMETRRIYGRYNPQGESENGSGHGCEPFLINPATYTRYLILDPGITNCATLMIAIDEMEQYMTVCEGFLIKKATARMWAHEVKIRENGYKFECIVCDQQMGKQGHMGRERVTVAKEFFGALKEEGVQLRQYGSLHGFFPSCNDVDGRTQALHHMMEIRGSGPFEGSCKLRVMKGMVPEMDKQVRRAAVDPNRPDKRYKNPKIPQDFLDDLEYAAAFGPGWHKPEPLEVEDETTPAANTLNNKRARQRRSPARRQHHFA